MNRRAILLAVFCLLAAAPAPLISGAVRDQFGNPIAGARVAAGTDQTQTAADGTFVLHSTARTVRIECRFCRPRTAAVDPDGTVAAIVQQYTALSSSVPSARDIEALPYARAESIVSLQPFTVLSDSSRALPGARTSLYGTLTPGLLIDAGIPMYDAPGGASPYGTIPGFDTSAVSVRGIEDAPLYGNLSGGGTFAVDEIPASGTGASALAGSQRGVRAWRADDPFSAALAAFADPGETSRRADAAAEESNAAFSLNANVFAASNDVSNEYTPLSSSASAARVAVGGTGALHPYIEGWTQRAGYSAGAFFPSAVWSDSAIEAGIRTAGVTSFFADISAQSYTSAYTYNAPPYQFAAGSTQYRLDAGARGASQTFSWQALLAAFDVEQRETGYTEPQRGLAPSLLAQLALAPQWTVLASTDEAWNTLPDERIGQDRLQLDYSDLQNVKLGITTVREWTRSQTQTSAGLYAAWQLTPALSLRAWDMHFEDGTQATPASAWLAYRAPSGMTADVIWRRDLLDGTQRPHLDGSIGLPLRSGLTLFAATEERGGLRYATIGLRAAQP